MDQRVRFPLNRTVGILVDFKEYDDHRPSLHAFELERKVIDKRGYQELRVNIPKAFVNIMKVFEERNKLLQLIEQKAYKIFYNNGKTRVVVMNNGSLKFRGPEKNSRKKYANEVYIKEKTFLTMLSFIDNDFNRDDETVDENVNVTAREEEENGDDDDDKIEGDREKNDDVEMSNSDDNFDATPSEYEITIEDVKVHEVITLN